MSTTDKLMQLLFSLFGQNYETKAIKQHKDILIDLRNVLEKRIEESSVKWEEPRKYSISFNLKADFGLKIKESFGIHRGNH